MDSDHRNHLIQKRAQLQLHLRFNEFVKAYVEPFIEILDKLQRLKIQYRIVSLRFLPQEFQPLFMEKLQTEPFSKYDLSGADIAMEDTVLEQLIDIFPNRHSSRYFPDFPVVNALEHPEVVLKALIREYRIKEANVYLCWLNYPFLLEVDLHDLAQKANGEMLDSWYGDALIFPKNLSWLIVYYAFEDEWRFGSNLC